jgi:hypothetical protein
MHASHSGGLCICSALGPMSAPPQDDWPVPPLLSLGNCCPNFKWGGGLDLASGKHGVGAATTLQGQDVNYQGQWLIPSHGVRCALHAAHTKDSRIMSTQDNPSLGLCVGPGRDMISVRRPHPGGDTNSPTPLSPSAI